MSACVYQTGEVHDLDVDCKSRKGRETAAEMLSKLGWWGKAYGQEMMLVIRVLEVKSL